MAKNRERGALLTDAEVCDLLKVEGVEIWTKPYDDRLVILTFGTLKRILARALRVEAASGPGIESASIDDFVAELKEQHGEEYFTEARNWVADTLYPEQAQQPVVAEPVAQSSYVQNVPDHCDRITWRGNYYHLPLATPPVADGVLSDDDMHRLHDQSQMGWGHDWRKFGRLVEAAALSRASSLRDEVEKDAARLKGLRELCGFVQNGSDTVIKIFQDDATREWVVKVGEESYCGRSFGTAIDAALLADAEAGKEE